MSGGGGVVFGPSVGGEIGGHVGFEDGKLKFGMSGALCAMVGIKIDFDIEIDTHYLQLGAKEAAVIAEAAFKETAEEVCKAADKLADTFGGSFGGGAAASAAMAADSIIKEGNAEDTLRMAEVNKDIAGGNLNFAYLESDGMEAKANLIKDAQQAYKMVTSNPAKVLVIEKLEAALVKTQLDLTAVKEEKVQAKLAEYTAKMAAEKLSMQTHAKKLTAAAMKANGAIQFVATIENAKVAAERQHIETSKAVIAKYAAEIAELKTDLDKLQADKSELEAEYKAQANDLKFYAPDTRDEVVKDMVKEAAALKAGLQAEEAAVKAAEARLDVAEGGSEAAKAKVMEAETKVAEAANVLQQSMSKMIMGGKYMTAFLKDSVAYNAAKAGLAKAEAGLKHAEDAHQEAHSELKAASMDLAYDQSRIAEIAGKISAAQMPLTEYEAAALAVETAEKAVKIESQIGKLQEQATLKIFKDGRFIKISNPFVTNKLKVLNAQLDDLKAQLAA